MKLYYFDIKDSPDVLKSKRNALIKKHHPDKAPEGQKATKTEIMKQINAEYEFLLKIHKQPKLKELTSNEPHFSPESMRLAQDIFNILTNHRGVDFFLLLDIITKIQDWKKISETYYHTYGISILKHLKAILPLNEGKMMLRIILKLMKSLITIVR